MLTNEGEKYFTDFIFKSKKSVFLPRIGFGYAVRHIRRRGNQVKILNRPATVCHHAKF